MTQITMRPMTQLGGFHESLWRRQDSTVAAHTTSEPQVIGWDQVAMESPSSHEPKNAT